MNEALIKVQKGLQDKLQHLLGTVLWGYLKPRVDDIISTEMVHPMAQQIDNAQKEAEQALINGQAALNLLVDMQQQLQDVHDHFVACHVSTIGKGEFSYTSNAHQEIHEQLCASLKSIQLTFGAPYKLKGTKASNMKVLDHIHNMQKAA